MSATLFNLSITWLSPTSFNGTKPKRSKPVHLKMIEWRKVCTTWSRLLGAQINMTCSVCRYAFSRPVVLRGLTDNTKFQRLCSKSSLLEKYGSLKVRLSTANTHSYRKVDVLLQEYVDEFLRPQSEEVLGSETLYFFGDNNFTEWQNLFDQYESPPYVLPDTTGAYSFGIA
ncbi:hypothetical protein AMECASPLE_035243, partial [Ameca splendens]